MRFEFYLFEPVAVVIAVTVTYIETSCSVLTLHIRPGDPPKQEILCSNTSHEKPSVLCCT